MGSNSADIGIRIFLDDAASKGLFAVNQQLGQIESLSRRAGLGFGSMSKELIGLSIVAGLAAAFLLFGGAIVYSTDQAAKLRTTMIGLQAATGATDAQLQQMQNTMLSLGASSIFSLDEIAAGFTIAGQRGQSAGDIIKYVGQQGIFLAESIGVKPVAAFSLLTSVMAAFNLPASQAAKTADLLFFAFEHGVPSVAQLQAGLAKLGSIASVLHIPLDQIIPAFDVLSRAMGSGGTAATSLYYFLNQVKFGTAAFRDEIAKLGLSFYDIHGRFIGLSAALDELYFKLRDKTPQQAAAILGALFNIRSSQGIGILLQDLKKLHDLTQQLKGSHDAMGQAMAQAKKAEDSLAGSTAALKTNLTDFAALAGGPIAAALTPLVKHFNDFISMLRTMAAENPKAFSSIMLIGAALAGLGLIVAIALSPFALLIGIMVAVVAIVAGLAAGIGWLSANWGALSTSMGPVGVAIRVIQGVFKDLASAVGPALKGFMTQLHQDLAANAPALKQFGAVMNDYVVPALKMLALIIVAVLIGALRGLLLMFTMMVSGIVSVFIGLAAIIGGALNLIKGIFMVFFGLLQGLSTHNWSLFSQGWSLLVSGVVAIIVGFGTIVKGILIGIFGALIGFVVGFVQGVISFFRNLSAQLVGHSIIPDMLKAILTAFVTFFANIISGIVSWVAHVISTIVAFAAKMLATFLAGINLIKALWNAGWAALIALLVAFVVNVVVHILVLKAQAQAKFTEVMTSIHTAITTGISKAIQFFKDLPGKIIAALSGLGQMLFNAGAAALQRFLDGINSIIQNIKNAILNLIQWIADHLPKSPAKMGPLKDLDKTGPAFVNEIARGIEAGTPRLSLALNRAFNGLNSVPRMSGGNYGGGTAVYYLMLDGQVLGSWVINHITGQMQMQGLGRAFK